MHCACGCFLYGATPERVGDGVIYGPGLHADVVVSKCDDSLPIERQAKRIRRAGIPMSRSSLNDVFHRAAELLVPIWWRILELIAQSEHVSADETPIKVQDTGKCRQGWIWTFIARGLVAYVFSASRSGQTPVDVLGETSGTIQVDGYSGYNTVSCPTGLGGRKACPHSSHECGQAVRAPTHVAVRTMSVGRIQLMGEWLSFRKKQRNSGGAEQRRRGTAEARNSGGAEQRRRRTAKAQRRGGAEGLSS